MTEIYPQKELIYGTIMDRLIFIPVEKVQELKLIYYALKHATTWGVVRQLTTEPIYMHLIRVANDMDVLSTAQSVPPDEELFCGRDFLQPEYGTYIGPSDAPDHDMIEWVPDDIQNRYGAVEEDRYGDTWLEFNPDRQDDLIRAFADHHYSCRNDQLSIDIIYGAVDSDAWQRQGSRPHQDR